jgi:hypothetical protein
MDPASSNFAPGSDESQCYGTHRLVVRVMNGPFVLTDSRLPMMVPDCPSNPEDPGCSSGKNRLQVLAMS